nr:hypothetical protein Iba_chr09aCG16630 [Ipomoea batatas]
MPSENKCIIEDVDNEVNFLNPYDFNDSDSFDSSDDDDGNCVNPCENNSSISLEDNDGLEYFTFDDNALINENDDKLHEIVCGDDNVHNDVNVCELNDVEVVNFFDDCIDDAMYVHELLGEEKEETDGDLRDSFTFGDESLSNKHVDDLHEMLYGGDDMNIEASLCDLSDIECVTFHDNCLDDALYIHDLIDEAVMILSQAVVLFVGSDQGVKPLQAGDLRFLKTLLQQAEILMERNNPRFSLPSLICASKSSRGKPGSDCKKCRESVSICEVTAAYVSLDFVPPKIFSSTLTPHNSSLGISDFIKTLFQQAPDFVWRETYLFVFTSDISLRRKEVKTSASSPSLPFSQELLQQTKIFRLPYISICGLLNLQEASLVVIAREKLREKVFPSRSRSRYLSSVKPFLMPVDQKRGIEQRRITIGSI